jgi:hypothetical protein
MNLNSIDDYSSIIKQIIFFTKNEKVRDSIIEVYKKYSEINEKNQAKHFQEALESLKWVAERTHNAERVEKVAKFLLMDSVIKITTKYPEDISGEILTSLHYCIENAIDQKEVEKYAKWMDNGHVGKLLDFAAKLNGNGNIKLKRDILSILYVDWDKTENFNEFASKINNKKLFLENKLELLSIIRDVVNINKGSYGDILINSGIENLRNVLQKDLNGIRIFNDISSIRAAIKFTSDVQKYSNVEFLFQKTKEFGSVKNWIKTEPVAVSVSERMKEAGFNTDFFIASGEIIAQRRGEGHYSNDWPGAFKSIVMKILGSKNDKTMPRISIPNVSPGSLYRKISVDYNIGLSGDKDSASKVLKELRLTLIKNFAKTRLPKSAIEILNDIEMLEKVLAYGGVVTFRGAKVTAKVWKRKIPNDLYDSENLWCCVFLPTNEKGEVPLIAMDPKSTLIQFFIQGLEEPVSCAFAFVGISKGKTTIFIDTVEAGALAYTALGQDKMKEFCYESILKFGQKTGADRVIFFSHPEYGRSIEFCSYLRDLGLKEEKVYFEAIDSEDIVLKKFSTENKHHYTDAFKIKPLKGKIKGFVVDI